MSGPGANMSSGTPAVPTNADLPGLVSIDPLVERLLGGSLLSNDRFEAQEFGRNEHSIASAGALLIGLSDTPEVSDDTVRRCRRISPVCHCSQRIGAWS